MRTEIATINDFAQSVREEMQERLSDKYPDIVVSVEQVDKIQGESYLGIRVDKGNGLASPVFDLQPAYEEAGFTGSLDRILDTLEEKIGMILQDMPQIGPDKLKDYETAKENMIMQVIPIKGNEERLAEMPHKEMEDMAVVCRVMIDGDYHGGQMSYLITNPVMQEFGVTKDELFADAAINMSERAPYSITPLFNVLAEMDPFYMDNPMPEPDNTLFVATNPAKMFGAGVIAQPGFMEDARAALRGSFFVLPSSIHEVLLLKDDGSTDYHDLLRMVTEINATQVAPYDRLTDNVYHYDALERVFETAKHFSERQAEKEFGRGSVLKDLAENRQKMQEHKPRAHDAPVRGGVAI